MLTTVLLIQKVMAGLVLVGTLTIVVSMIFAITPVSAPTVIT
jgi:hypothetical protein